MMTQRYRTAFSSLSSKKIGSGSDFMDAFERQKRIFNGDSHRTISLPLKMTRDQPDGEMLQYDSEEYKVVLTW
jgi:hypothetical protein